MLRYIFILQKCAKIVKQQHWLETAFISFINTLLLSITRRKICRYNYARNFKCTYVFLICVLNFTLPARGSNFAEVSRTTNNIQWAPIYGYVMPRSQ
jgi:hypothetical protein